MQEIADELYESWVNGNHKHVIERVCENWGGDAYESRARSALLGALLATAMQIEDRMTFMKMLRNRMQEEG